MKRKRDDLERVESMVMFADSPLSRSALARHKAEDWSNKVFSNTSDEYASRVTLYSRKSGFCLTIEEDPRPAWFSPEEAMPLYNPEVDMLILVGTNGQEMVDYVMIVLAEVEDKHLEFSKDRFVFGKDLRKLFLNMPVEEVNMLGLIKAKADWHLDNQFCAKCGGRSAAVEAGAKRRCLKCRTKHYPTMQPTAIMAIRDDIGRFLLCRQKNWPKGMWSCLSGFCDIGESIEDAVIRETFEEGGIRVKKDSIQILKTQPWPLNRGAGCAFMIGCFGKAENTEIVLDEEENEDVKWFTVEEIKSMLEKTQDDTQTRVPGPYAVANYIIRQVVNQPL